MWNTTQIISSSSYMQVSVLPHVNSLRPSKQDGRHFADDIFKGIFLNETIWIPINISLKFLPQGPINNILALVQNKWLLDYRRIYASLGLNELILDFVNNRLYSSFLLPHIEIKKGILFRTLSRLYSVLEIYNDDGLLRNFRISHTASYRFWY